jgi:hypothetical protein
LASRTSRCSLYRMCRIQRTSSMGQRSYVFWKNATSATSVHPVPVMLVPMSCLHLPLLQPVSAFPRKSQEPSANIFISL